MRYHGVALAVAAMLAACDAGGLLVAERVDGGSGGDGGAGGRADVDASPDARQPPPLDTCPAASLDDASSDCMAVDQ